VGGLRGGEWRGVESLVVAAERENGAQKGEDVGARNGEMEDDDDDEKPSCWEVTVSGLKAFWKFFRTWTGFFVTIYMLNGTSLSTLGLSTNH